ncbi:microcystin degradation protein MlrC [Loktanella sp. D2R18]|uniref:M81 family metallopeptidase n=1 Tax=Rhodobacterales TaxID=204455 RepID=UPI000DEA08A6|nr:MULTISPECIES: M81 family metallopeptidase [Rhodobacterales]MDO6591900.1 M81 family metallopeptidase [Yoonia sp. 1_MG-2023]RBW42669.1 microcystin degradation protein MlrC [Loktanella sp. D2R18]
MRIAIGGLHTECSTYNPLLQQVGDFHLSQGSEVLPALAVDMPDDVASIGLSYANSVPGGPLTAQTYAQFKDKFLAQLRDTMPLDGVYLSMHGAVHVVGLEDAEGDWLSAVRDVIGTDVPLAVSYDLHGNVTQQIIDQIDIFAGYRTAPHIDVRETRQRALGMLVDHLRGGQKPVVAWAKVPVLMPGERSSTEDEPAKGLYAALPIEDSQSGVLDANLMVGYVWADTPRGTACAVVTGVDTRAALDSASRLAQAYWDARADFAFGVETKPLDDCLDDIAKLQSSPVILADSGDNPTGGGVGDRADVLDALLKRGARDALIGGLADAPAANAACAAGVGAQVELTIGATLGLGGPVVTATCNVVCVLGTIAGRNAEVLVETAGIRIILTARRRPFHNLDDFRKFGIEPAEQRLIVVKSGYLSPDLAPLANPALMALTDGAVNQDIPQLENKNRVQPMYPFQTDFTWTPTPELSARARNSGL